MSPKAGKNDEARERSRAALLQAGADLLVETSLRNPFAAMRLRSICERAGYSTGAFYLHWTNIDDYYTDLTDLLHAGDAFDADFAALMEEAGNSAGASTLTVITRVADRDLQLLLDNPLYAAMELLNVTWGRSRLQAEMADEYRRLDHDTGQAYGTILAKRGRKPRPPFDWDRIGAILQSMIEGFTLRHKIDPAAGVQSSGPDLGLYAASVAAVLAVVTHPAGDDANFGEAAQALLDGEKPGS